MRVKHRWHGVSQLLNVLKYLRWYSLPAVLAVVFMVACSENPLTVPDNTAPQFSGGRDRRDDDRDDDDDEDDDDDDHDRRGGKSKYRIVVTPPFALVKVNDRRQLKAHTKSKCVDKDKKDKKNKKNNNSGVVWRSNKPWVATVDEDGTVKGVSPGVAIITAQCGKKSDSSYIIVYHKKHGHDRDGEGDADPTQLPAADGRQPAPGTYGRTLTSGQTYEDPNTGVVVLKVTDPVTPIPNLFMDHGYSEGGPIISQPWRGSDGNTYYTLKVAQHLVDLRYSTLELLNWRPLSHRGEIGVAFSLNPATPRIAYVITSDAGIKRVDRYNTATNRVENVGNWPWIVTALGENLDWLQTNLNDTWFVAMLKEGPPTNPGSLIGTVVAFRPSDGLQQDFTPVETLASHDEPHIDRELPFVYIATNTDERQNIIGNLETGAIRVPTNSVIQSDDHEAPLRGMVTGLSNFTRYRDYYYDVRTDQTVEYTSADNTIGFPGDWHMAGQWVMPGSGNGAGPSQWFTMDAWGAPDPQADIQSGFIGFVRPSPFSARLLVAHDSRVDTYQSQPQTTLAPDGKLAMWSSNMQNAQGGRTDVFVARVPTR
jgi:hypothetical protein